MSLRALVALLLAVGASCSPSPAPPRFQSLLEVPATLRQGPPGGALALTEGARWEATAGVLELERAVPAALWARAGPGRWSCPQPSGYLPSEYELRQGTRTLTTTRLRERLVVAEPDWSVAPEDVRLHLRIARAAAGEHGGALFALWPGEAVRFVLDVPSAAALRFRLLVLPTGVGPASEGTLSVEQDGQALSTFGLRSGDGSLEVPREVELAPARASRLVLRVTGEALVWLVSPLVGPRTLGTPEARPWPDARPDLVLFLADTFRADLLTMNGGDGDTPALDALAQRSLRFHAARSTSTWTLPAHASLFTGLFPGQHGADRPDRRFDPALVTLAETLRRAGYRTGAVTEAGYVRRVYGLDQGFETFQEQPGVGGPRLARTLDRAQAFLDADDGRPLFLFVHTYRTHWPYQAEDEDQPLRAIALRRAQVQPSEGAGTLDAEGLAELQALYRSTARALDAAFAPWFTRLEASGRLRQGLFVFTSDHGEAFQEHGALFHGEAPREPVARIPLLLHGGTLTPADVAFGASLVDLFPTLVTFAGVPLPGGLAGVDLRTLAEERPLVSETRSPRAHHLAVVEGTKKLLARAAEGLALPRDVEGVYDLEHDPEERADLRPTPAGQVFLVRAAEAWHARAQPRGTAREAELDASTLDELRALGYGE